MKKFAIVSLMMAAAAVAHADVLVTNDSTLYYLDDKDYDEIVTINVKKQVILPSGLDDAQKSSIMALLDRNSSIKEVDGVLKETDPTLYTPTQAKPLTDKVRRKIENQNKKGRTAINDWIVCEYVKPMPEVDGVVVLCSDFYMYGGGAHGMDVTRFINYSLSENRPLTLSDLVDIDKPQVKEALQKELTALFNKKYEAEWGDLREFRDTDLLPVSDDFYLTDKGVAFVYQQYGVGPYAIGQPALEVPYLTLLLINNK